MSTDSSQNMNFNPSWMQPSAPLKSERPNGFLNRSATEDTEASQEMIDPVFAQHRYGREDILALMGKDSTKPPDGLEKCPFFLEKAQVPIILLPFNDNEMRLQQNINSSKALSALNRQDRHHMLNGSEAGSPSSGPANNSGWVVAGSNRGGGGTVAVHSHKPSPNRWSALAPSTGNTKSSTDVAYVSTEPYFAKRSIQGGNSSGSGGGQSTYNKPPRTINNNSEHRSTTNSRYRTTSTSKDQPSALNENVAKLLESQHSAAAPSTSSSSTSSIWAKIGISTKDSIEGSKEDIAKESKEKDWLKYSSPPSQQQQDVFDRNEGASKPANHAKSTSPPSNVPVYTGGFGAKSRLKPEMTTSELETGLEYEKGYSKPYAPAPITQPPAAVAPVVAAKPQVSPLAMDFESTKWYYLDPVGIQQGPFEGAQMQVWYESTYFDESLRLRRVSDTDYTTLGDLFRINGKTSPFTTKIEATQPSPKQTIDAAASSIWTSIAGSGNTSSAASNIIPDFAAILSGVTGVGMRSASAGLNNQHQHDIENERQMLLLKEMQIREEERKLREKEENLRREDRERQEKERRMHQKEIELSRKQEELQRIEIEKERDFENRRLQMAELERRKREALERMEEKIRNEHLQQLRQKEEENRRRAQELEEGQRQLYEAEARKKKEAEDTRIRLAYEEARRQHEMAQEAAKKMEEEQRQRLLQEQQRRMQREAEEIKAQEDAERKRQKQQLAEQKKLQEEQRKQEALRIQQQQLEEELNRAVIEALLNESNPIPVEKAAPTPWVTVGTAKPVAKKGSSSKNGAEKQQKHAPQKSLLEIQEEEKKALQQKLLKQQELLETHNKNAQLAQQQQTCVQKSAWGSPTQVFPGVVESHIGKSANNKKKAGASGSSPNPQSSSSNGRSWNAVPVAEPSPIPKAKPQQVQQAKVQKAKQKTEIKLVIDTPKKPDAFTAWIIKRVRELNSSVDAEVFASFIEGVDSPNEAEDYIIGYLGESKVVKDFHREFLQKRIELRPRVVPASKDDLSGPAAAFSSSTGSNGSSGGQQAPHSSATNNSISHASNTTGSAAGDGVNKKKKKGGKGKLVLDAATLGFRPAGDPNRVNAGEIDTAVPVPTRKNR